MIAPTLSQTWTCHFGAIAARIFPPVELVQQEIILDLSCQIASYGELYTRFIRDHKRVNRLRDSTSTFVDFWENLNLRRRTMRQCLESTAHPNMRWLRPLWILLHQFKCSIAGAHRAWNIDWSIYVSGSPSGREYYPKNLRTIWPSWFWSREYKL